MKMSLICATAMLGCVATLAPVVEAQDNYARPRMITTTGTAEIKVAPDQVALTLGVDSHEKELSAAKVNNDVRVKKLIGLARSGGVDAKNIQTSALSMGPEYSDEKIPKLLGYQVSQTVTITLADLSKYEELMTSALKAGVNRVDGINFFLADPSKEREEARAKAIRAARDKAMTMAAELGQKLGKPWEITEENGLDTTAGLMANSLSVRYKMPMQEAESTIAGGELTIRASVRVSFQLE